MNGHTHDSASNSRGRQQNIGGREVAGLPSLVTNLSVFGVERGSALLLTSSAYEGLIICALASTVLNGALHLSSGFSAGDVGRLTVFVSVFMTFGAWFADSRSVKFFYGLLELSELLTTIVKQASERLGVALSGDDCVRFIRCGVLKSHRPAA